MELKFNCPRCGQHIAVDASAAGLDFPCPTCKHGLTVPLPASVAGCRGRSGAWVPACLCALAAGLGVAGLLWAHFNEPRKSDSAAPPPSRASALLADTNPAAPTRPTMVRISNEPQATPSSGSELRRAATANRATTARAAVRNESRWAMIVLHSGIYPARQSDVVPLLAQLVGDQEMGVTAAGLGIDRTPVRMQTIVDLVGEPDALTRSVRDSDGVFDEYKYGPIAIKAQPGSGWVRSVVAPTAWWKAGLRKLAAAELQRATHAAGLATSVSRVQ